MQIRLENDGEVRKKDEGRFFYTLLNNAINYLSEFCVSFFFEQYMFKYYDDFLNDG